MNSAIEIHDSTVAEISEDDGLAIVHFRPAHLHKSEGRPAFDSGTGWVQAVRLIFSGASVSGDLPEWPCTLMNGEMILNGERHDNLIPVPLEINGCIELRLICDSVHTVTVTGRGVRLELVGEPKYVEDVEGFLGHNPAT